MKSNKQNLSIGLSTILNNSESKILLLSAILPAPEMNEKYEKALTEIATSGKKYLYVDLTKTSDKGMYDILHSSANLSECVVNNNGYDVLTSGTATLTNADIYTLTGREDILTALNGYDKVLFNLPDLQASDLLLSCGGLSKDVILTVRQYNMKMNKVGRVFDNIETLGMKILGINFAKKKTLFDKIMKR